MSHLNAGCSCTEEWVAVEARFHRAKEALLDAQQRHCEAAQELLAARAQMGQMLGIIFPEAPAPACEKLGAEAERSYP